MMELSIGTEDDDFFFQQQSSSNALSDSQRFSLNHARISVSDFETNAKQTTDNTSMYEK